ncbi:MAG: CoA transferase [Ilumatobacteraceae bacterium]|nr:CoA transferase [Ilumatobacteraceae bacterium]
MSGPLAGIRVLDLSTMPSGAQASQLLADFGADVIQVEHPGGSPLRREPAYPFLGRGKRSIAIDLADPVDHQLVLTLMAGADVVIETFRPGVMERFGLGYDTVSVVNPAVVYASITGFGRIGPYADVQGYEALVMAKLGGFSTVAGMVKRPGPAFISVPFGAFAASQTALHGILAALHEREHSGHGQRVDTSLVQGIASLGTWNWFVRVITDKYPDAFTPQAPFTEDNIPTSPIFFMLLICLTADGRWLQFGQVRPHLFFALMKALGLDGLYADPAFKTAPLIEDEAKRVEFWERLLEAARQRTLAEWQEVFERDHNVWGETMRRDSELLDHPQMVHLGGAIEIDDLERGTVRMPGALVQMFETPAELVAGAPRFDEHAAEIRANPWTPRPAPTTTSVSDDRGPLHDVTVVELGTFFAAPFGGNVLADLGARVIKVESLDGEPMRTLLPFPETGAAKVMQGKESISVDLGSHEGRAIVHRLVERADIVLQSFRAGVAERQGVDEATLRAINPALIYLNAPGYGTDGPCGDRPAYAPTIGAGAGFVMRNLGTSVPEHADLTIPEIRDAVVRLSVSGTTEFAQADGVAALATATAMTLALLIRDRTGVGQGMLTTMLTSAAHALCEDLVVWDGRSRTNAADPELYGYSARYRLYEASDGWIFLAVPMPSEWARLVAAMAREVDLSDVRFADERGRWEHDAEIARLLTDTFVRRPGAHWEATLIASGVGAVVVDSGPPEKVLLSDAFGRASQLLVDVDHPTFGEHPRLAPLVSMSRTAASVGPGVLQGQHTVSLLGELGFSPDEIAALHDRKVVVS